MLKIENITKTYQEKVVVNSVSLTVKAGEILVIVGESGSGKTTLLNIISGNIQPDSGSLHLDNQPIDLYFNRLIRDFPSIKLVPQDYRLKPDYTVSENIDLALTKFKNEYRVNRVKELIELCGISEIHNIISTASRSCGWPIDRKSTRLNSSHRNTSRMPSSA